MSSRKTAGSARKPRRATSRVTATSDAQPATTPPNPKKSKSSKRMGKRLLKDLIAFLRGLPAVTFVLYSRGISSYGPNLTSAIHMMSQGSRGAR